MKIGVDGHPQGAYLGTWGIRNSLSEKATAPRWAGPGLSEHNPCSWGLDLHPTPHHGHQGQALGKPHNSCFYRAGAPEPLHSQPVSTATGQTPPSPCPRPRGTGTHCQHGLGMSSHFPGGSSQGKCPHPQAPAAHTRVGIWVPVHT